MKKTRKISTFELKELFKVKNALDRYTDFMGRNEKNSISDKIWDAWISLFNLFDDNRSLYDAYLTWYDGGDVPKIEVIETYEGDGD